MITKYKNFNWKVNELQINYKPSTFEDKLNTPEKTYEVLNTIWDFELLALQEQFYVLFLTNDFKLLSWKLLGTGNMNSVDINIKLLCSLALKTMCSSVILAHNHPSGGLLPSAQDISITVKVAEILNYFNIAVQDHLIMGTKIGSFSSLRSASSDVRLTRIWGKL